MCCDLNGSSTTDACTDVNAVRVLQVEIMMALEEKFDLTLDEEGKLTHPPGRLQPLLHHFAAMRQPLARDTDDRRMDRSKPS